MRRVARWSLLGGLEARFCPQRDRRYDRTPATYPIEINHEITVDAVRLEPPKFGVVAVRVRSM